MSYELLAGIEDALLISI